MKKKVITKIFKISCFLIIVILMSSCQRAYRIQNININNKNIEFILPPDAKLTKKDKDKFILNDKYRFHWIKFENISNDYFSSLEALENFDYQISKEDNFNSDISKSCSSPSSSFCKFSATANSLEVQFDYTKISSETNLINFFNELPIEFLKVIGNEEATKKWVKSIPQNIVEKIFEIIPVPQETVLARYGSIIDNEKSFTLLNSNLKLLMDQALYQNNPKPPNSWHFSLISQSKIRFYRNHNGDIKQSEFLDKIDTTNLPNNFFIKKGNVTNLASSVDIQLSNGTTSKDYYGLYQSYFKRNASGSTFGIDDCEDTRENPSLCNSVLLLSDNLTNLYDCIDSQDITNCEEVIIGSFGKRNLITPLQLVYIDSYPFEITFNSKVYNLVYPYMFTKNFKIKRLYNRKYYPLKEFSKDTIILPGDTFRR